MDVLQFLHEKGVAHRDLKAQNIMLQRNGLLKLIDFGLARDDMPSEIHSNSKIGTKCYWAPELFGPLQNDQAPSLANYKVDLWALGVLNLYICTF